jgi:hypothetical protein
MTDQVTDPTDAERQWIAGNIGLAEAMASSYGISERPLGPLQLDEIWTRWMGGARLGIDDPNHFINAVGLAFGSYLAGQTGLAWKVIEDQYGVEMALYSERGDIRVFPANLVAKRFERREGPFFPELARELTGRVAEVKQRSGNY